MAKTIGTDINQVEITSLSHIKGQPQVQELLRVNIDAFFRNKANNENSGCGPFLLLGPSGVGKTLTAKAIHAELANLKLIVKTPRVGLEPTTWRLIRQDCRTRSTNLSVNESPSAS
jgi:Holliday junction resolvasome RuvABC ATP-dependent DNA helicase subunit